MKETYGHIDIRNEKVKRIINAGFHEFAYVSFKKASTNNIVKKAGVSRGLLYHYFDDKQALYDFLKYYSGHVILERLNESRIWEEKDFIKRIRNSVLIKFDVIRDYPNIMNFYLNTHDVQTIETAQKSMGEEFAKLLNLFYTSEIDETLFNEGIDVEKAQTVIRWTLEKCGEAYQRMLKETGQTFDPQGAIDFVDTYIKFLKETFYK